MKAYVTSPKKKKLVVSATLLPMQEKESTITRYEVSYLKALQEKSKLLLRYRQQHGYQGL